MAPHWSNQQYSRGNWTEAQKLLASDAGAMDRFGYSVSLDGDTILIGAYHDDDNGSDSGSAYVFTRSGTIWIQQAKLVASDGAAGDNFGYYVSLSGDTALIGAPLDNDNGNFSGSAYVFIRIGTTWAQQTKILASDGAPGDNFGWCVALDGDTALIGALYGYGNIFGTGCAYIFTRSGTIWTQQQKIFTLDGQSGDLFSYSVSLNGDTGLIGVSGDDDNKGSAYVFTRSGTTWTQQAKLVASDGTAGDDFGIGVSINDDTALIGADQYWSNSFGLAYVFVRSGATWTQQAKLVANDHMMGDRFGYCVSLDGDTALIGAPIGDGVVTNSGEAYMFIRTGITWTQQARLFASDGQWNVYFGCSVFLDGDTALIGEFLDDNNGQAGTGSAYIFIKENQPAIADFTWTPQNPSQNQPITFDASTSHDPDGTLSLYEWDWDNNGVYDESYSNPTATHTWTSGGSYPVTVRVTDDGNATGTVTKTIDVSAVAPSLTVEDFKGGIGVSAVVKNVGNGTATNITWSIDLVGKMIFKGNHWTGSIESLAPGDTQKIKTGVILGFGKIYINATATCAEGATYSEEGQGILLLFLAIGVKEPLP